MIRITSIIAASLMATSAFAAEEVAPAPQPIASISAQEGSVLVNTGEQFVTATDAQVLNVGDRVMVMEGGTAEIVFTDGCILPLASGSLLQVPAQSTCAGQLASIQSIGPSYAEAVGDNDGGPSTLLVTTAVGLTLAAIAATTGGESEKLPEPPVSP